MSAPRRRDTCWASEIGVNLFLKLVPDRSPNADGAAWLHVGAHEITDEMIEDWRRGGQSWLATEHALAPLIPKGYHLVLVRTLVDPSYGPPPEPLLRREDFR
jgi:hypothetical protein